jgi:hypothetical protein
MTEKETRVVQRTITRYRGQPLNLTYALLKLPFMTIELAQEIITEVRGTNLAEEVSELIVMKGNEVQREHLQFLWEPILPIGKLVHFGGNSSQGKSPVTVDIIARLTSAKPWPNEQANENSPKNVILLNIEDDLADTILPRLDLAGGDDKRLFYIKGTKITKGSSSAEMGLALDRDISLLADLARNTQDLGLIVIDPITNYLGKMNMNREDEVRSVLSPLAALAAELKVTVVTVGHFNRREKGTDPLHRMMGAAAFSGVARAVYAFGPDPDSESPYDHIISAARGNIGDSSLKYRTEIVEREWAGQKSKVVRIAWTGTTTANAEDAVDPDSRQDKSQLSEAAQLLREFLKAGRRPAKECQDFLRASGFDPAKVNTLKVRRKAQVQSMQRDKQHWWYIETRQSEF